MIFAFLSKRVRTWLLLTVALPLVGSLLETVGVKVGSRNPRAGDLLRQAGGYARTPVTRAQRRRARRALR
jgi:hypothetical protein